MNRGKLIAFEGLDGCGKTTQIDRLAAKLLAAGCDVVQTFEPTNGKFGRRIRATASSGASIPPAEELRWFVEDRRAHVADVLRPALAAGKIVLTDRYYLSTVAYQGARGADPERILSDSEAEFPHPDLVLLLEVPPGLALERVHERGGAVETRFENSEFLEAVAEIFHALDRSYLARIDASGSPDAVERAIAECVAERLALL